ncbi:MAG: AMP-binding protein [Acidobacteria bacterium]|nr:AMP-binding protein [Acidobacteriota bacterium]
MEFFDCTVGELLEETARTHPDREAIIYSDRDLKYSYRELNARVDRLARGMLALGIGKGDHVGIWATNVPDWLTVFYATARIGAVFVTVNTSYRPSELEYVMQQSDMKALFLIDGYRDTDYVQALYDLVPELKTMPKGSLQSARFPFLKTVVYIGPSQHRGMYSLAEIMDLENRISAEEFIHVKASLDPHDTVNMQYTSGTTGFPKGVMLSHYGIINNGFSIGQRQQFTGIDRLCLPVPLFHCFGITLGVMAVLTHGATILPLETFDPLMVLAIVQKERCTALYGVPTMFIAELTHPMFNMFDLTSLRTGIMAGSPCPEPVMRQVMEKMHCSEITIVYGLTEASPGITQTRTDDPVHVRVSTVGKPFEGVEVKIINPDTGETLAPGGPGELCSRGYNTMKGYYKMPQQTAEVLNSDGWLRTGDQAVEDEDGFIRITGRLKDVIIRGGENIYPKEVEDFLREIPNIRDVQIVAVPSEKYGEEAAAFVQLRDGISLEAAEIQDFCRGKIARYKIPRHIFFTDSYPMTASGKIQKYKLREEAARRLTIAD